MRFSQRLFGLIMLLASASAVSAEPPQAPSVFEGVVIEVSDSLVEAKSLSGEIADFVTLTPSAGSVAAPPALRLSGLRKGDLVQISYAVVPDGNSPSKLVRVIALPMKIIGRSLTGTIKEISADKSWMVVRTQHPEKAEREINVPILTPVKFQPLVDKMRPGDGVHASYTERAESGRMVQTLEWQSKTVYPAGRWISLIGAASLLVLLAFVFTKHPTALFIGEDGRYSTSKFQTVLWFWLVISAYMAIVFHRIAAAGWDYIGGVDIPQNLLILSGISVLTFTTAKLITVGKIEKGAARGEAVKPSAETPRIGDLIRTDSNKIDLGDYQMLVVTLLAVIVYATSAVEFMRHIEFRREITMPDVDATLLAIFGLGQAAYLGKKAAGDDALRTMSARGPGQLDGTPNVLRTEAVKTAALQVAETKEAEAR